MKAKLLRLATRDRDGTRRWIVPGFGNGVAFQPSSRSKWGVPALHWPARDARGEHIRGVRLDWHKSVARQEILALVAAATPVDKRALRLGFDVGDRVALARDSEPYRRGVTHASVAKIGRKYIHLIHGRSVLKVRPSAIGGEIQ